MATNVLIDTTNAIVYPLQTLWIRVSQIIPSFVGAIIVLIIGYFIALVLGHAVRILIDKTRLDEKLRIWNLTKAVGHTDISALLGEFVKWWIVIIFLGQAVQLVNLGTLTVLLNRIVLWLPKLLVAIIVFLFGLGAAYFVELKIAEHTRLKGMKMVGTILKWLIIIMITLVAVRNIGVDIVLIEDIFKWVIVALAAGIALALGIGLGLGLKKESESFIKNIKKSL